MKPRFPSRLFTCIDCPLASITAALLAFGASAHAQTNNYFGTTGTLSGNVWSTNPAGPYTSALDTTGGAIINFGNPAPTITGASITVAGINATADATLSAIGGTISNEGNAVIPIDVAGGTTLNFAGQAFTTSGTAGYIKNGLGTVALAGGTYGGGFTLNAGTVAVGGVNAMGDGGTLTINGGTIRSNGTAARDLSNKYDTGIVVGGNFTLGDTVNYGILTFSNNVALGASTRTITANGAAVFSGIISGDALVGLVKEGPGAIVLAGTANTYNGPTTINAGTVSFRTPASDGASTYAFPAGSAIGLGVGTDRFTDAEVLAIFAGTVPASLPTVTINAATNISIDTTAAAHTLSTNIPASTRGLEKILGGANLTLTGANEYSGRTVVWGAGGMVVTSLGNIGDASSNVGTNSTIDLMTGARIDINGATPATSNKNFNIAGSSTIFAATATGTLNLSGSISTETAGAKTVSLGTNATIAHTVSGTISDGSGTLAVTRGNNAGRWVLSGNNTYSGGTTLSAGITDINSATAIGSGPLTTGATMDNSSGAAITLSTNNQVNWNGNFVFTGTNDLNLGMGNTIMNGNRQVTVTGGRLTMGGVVSSPFGANGWTKLGNGTLVLANSSNTNSGRNTHSAGVVEVSTMANFGAPSSLGAQGSADGLWIAGGATLRYVGSADVTTNRGFTLSTSGGSIIESSGVGTLSFGTPANPLAFNGAGTRGLVLGGSNTGDNTFGKNLTNNGVDVVTLSKEGAGKWIMSQSNSYTGPTAINGGTLVITGASQGTSAITFSGGGVLGLNTATPVNAGSATINFTGQSVLVTGPTGAASYTLLTALSIPPGTAPTLAAGSVSGYELQVVGNQLRLVQTGAGSPYDTWATGKGLTGASGSSTDPAKDADPDQDGSNNLSEFAFSGNPLSGSDNGKVFVLTEDSDFAGDPSSAKELILTIAVRTGTPVFTGSPSPSATQDGITYRIEGSLDLASFPTTVNVVPTPVVPIELPAAGTGYEYRSFSLDGSNGLTGKGFLRAKVTAP